MQKAQQGINTIMCFVLLLMSISSYGEIYTWTDEHGNTHFGDKKRQDVKQKPVELDVQESNWKKFNIEINDVDGILSNQEKQMIADDVNRVYEFFDRYLYFNMYKTVPVKVRLYKTKKSYQDYLAKQYDTHNAKHSRGIYIRSSNEIVLFENPTERWRTFWTIKHEASHAITDTVTPFVPAWLNEGIAENMEALTGESNQLALAEHQENYDLVRHGLKSGRQLDVHDFLSLSSQSFYEALQTGTSMNQANAGELVRLLLSSRPGKDFLTRLIHIYELGDRTFSSYLVDQHYIGGLIVLQDDWDRWVLRSSSREIKF